MSDSLPPISAHLTISNRTVLDTGPVAPRQVKADAAEQFEAFVLQSFIQEMLPKEAENVFGRGLAGDIWRSLLSEKFAAELAHRSPLGIADQVRVNGNGAEARAEIASLEARSRIAELIGDGSTSVQAGAAAPAVDGS